MSDTVESAARAASKAQRLAATYRYWGSAYRDWADDCRRNDGKSLLRHEFPDLSEETYKKITVYLADSGMRENDNAWDAVEAAGIYEDDETYEAQAAYWRQVFGKWKEISSGSNNSLFSTEDDKALITEISTYVADRVGGSLVGEPSRAENRWKEHNAELQKLIDSGVSSAQANKQTTARPQTSTVPAR